MDVFYAYTYSTGAWLLLQSIPLIGMPRMITTMLQDEARPPSPLEIYLSRCLGFGLLTIALLIVMLTGSVPLSSTLSEPISTEENDPKAPYAVPTLVVTTLFHAASAFYAYTWYTTTGLVGFAAGMVGHFIIAAVGLWCVLFGSSHGKISRRSGADRRTTGFPFSNREAERKHAAKRE
ncbi:hypothetical protein PHISP_01869 [Aspergillus sp. HF37]|nr:hypothetical protein PHISP_01869 [Aspergillus sp. HF37]